MTDPAEPASVIGGLHAVKSILKSDPGGVEALYVLRGRRDSRLRSLLDLAKRAQLSTSELSRPDLDAKAGNDNHQGILVLYRGAAAGTESELHAHVEGLTSPALILVLDEIQDPHNLGACLRSADAAGVDAVVTPLDNAVGITPVVRKVAAGAAESVRLFRVVNLPRTLRKLQQGGIWVYGTAGEASTSVHSVDWTGPIALVMGAEGAGMRRLTRESCDELVRIPMRGTVSSLNVSVATGVTLFEIRRQRDRS